MKISYILLLIISSLSIASENVELYSITRNIHGIMDTIEIFKADKNYFYTKASKRYELSEANYLNAQIEIERFTLKHKSETFNHCENSYQIKIQNREFKGCFKLDQDPFNYFYFNLHKYL